MTKIYRKKFGKAIPQKEFAKLRASISSKTSLGERNLRPSLIN